MAHGYVYRQFKYLGGLLTALARSSILHMEILRLVRPPVLLFTVLRIAFVAATCYPWRRNNAYTIAW
eukprot:364857-Chlamydomonas_euryale.AAC.3